MVETAYFKKILLTTKVKLSNGQPIPWINVGWQTGALETNNELITKELSALAKEGKGGVQVIDKATFEELKKNSGKQSPKPSGWNQRVTHDAGLTHQTLSTESPKEPSEKPSKSDAAAKPKERTEKPATATGVFPADK